MNGNPLVGVLFHWLGGLSSASFYVPYKGIRRWSWEVFWLVGGLFSWAVAPWLFASIQTVDLLGVLGGTPTRTLGWCWFWGAMWGLGGLTFGLTMRYLGLSLGMAVALGLTTVIGTLGPPLFAGQLGELVATPQGRTTLLGIGITLAGIAVVAWAGAMKERELGAGASEGVSEFNLRKGMLIAVFSGVMSSCFAFGLDAGQPIRDLTLKAGTSVLWQGLPVLCVVLAGGLTTNAIWCGWLIRRNGSAGEVVGRRRWGATSHWLHWAARCGTSSSFSTRWARARWDATASAAGRCTWPASSSSPRCGVSRWVNGAAPACAHVARCALGLAALVGATVLIGLANQMAGH